MEIITGWHCVVTDASTTDCVASATTTYTGSVQVAGYSTSTASSTVVMYGDWIFVMGIIIALLAFSPLSFIWSVYRINKK